MSPLSEELEETCIMDDLDIALLALILFQDSQGGWTLIVYTAGKRAIDRVLRNKYARGQLRDVPTGRKVTICI